MKKLFRNPIVLLAVGFIGGMLAGDKVKPMLAGLPVVGKFFQPK